jgi:hypothetical protein
MPRRPLRLSLADARRLALRAQALDADAPFGAGPDAVRAAVERLGYVQIDTIHVIERAHLATRIPAYRRADLAHAQSVEKSVFEYWAHALAYLTSRDYRFAMPAMQRHLAAPAAWFARVTPSELSRTLARIRAEGPLSIRDLDDLPRVAKDHPWASTKPAKRALELAFFQGRLAVGARTGMVKTYDLAERHFGWTSRPRPASAAQVLAHRLDRALAAQGVIDLDSACYMDAPRKPAMAALIEARLRARRLLPATIEGVDRAFWTTPEAAAALPLPEPARVHLLSPFDPLVIQRRRFAALFGHDHRFEAYVPAAKRVLGYFALPTLVGERVAAALDLKADRAARRLDIRKWTWLDGPRDGDAARIEAALDAFAAFQFRD